MARETNSSTLISACLPLLSTDIPRLLKLKFSINQLKEVLRLPSIKAIGGEHQLRLVANWMDSEVTPGVQINPVDQLNNLLPLVDLSSITETSMLNFMCENLAITTNPECRLLPPHFFGLTHELN